MPSILSPSLIKLLSILNDGKYHESTTLSSKLKMTPITIWQAVKKLQDYGIKLETIEGKGYALLEPLVLLDKKIIQNKLEKKNIALEIVESIPSTHDYLKSAFNQPGINICMAEEQTKGKGRLDRPWYSPFGKNIYLSLLYPLKMDMRDASGLSLMISLAIITTCDSFILPHPILVKWPNDVVYQQKKLAGNLIELQPTSHGGCIANIGIGINVNLLHSENHDIDQAWISLREMAGEYIDRNCFAARLINHLLMYLSCFEKHGLSAFTKEWHQVDSLMGKTVTLNNMTQQIRGLVQGINERGYLLLQHPDETVHAYSSGDTQILKQ